MERWQTKWHQLNSEMNGLPHKLLVILVLLACLTIAFSIFPLVAPFVCAALFAWMIDPLVRLLTRLLTKLRLKRNVAAALCTLVVFGIALALVSALFIRLFEEIKSLAVTLPSWAARMVNELVRWAQDIDITWDVLGDSVNDVILEVINALGRNITGSASQLAAVLARGVWNTATVAMPEVVLFTMLTIMGTFYMSSDPARILGFLKSLIPQKAMGRSVLLKNSFFKAVFSQLRAQLLMLCVTFVELLIGFSIIGFEYSSLLALLIALLDALPVVGTGLFLLPFSLYGLFAGDYRFAIGNLVLYFVVGLVRQFIEPRIIGKQLGINPLATMMSMYAGYRLMGFLGMVLGPMVLVLCKVAVTATEAKTPESQPPKDSQVSRLRFQRKLTAKVPKKEDTGTT